LFSKSNPLINLEGDALDAIIGMKTKWSSARVAASEIIVKASGSTGEGLEISLNTSQRMGVVNLVITYKIDGGNLIDFILHFYLL
jgi:hypothetical protein